MFNLFKHELISRWRVILLGGIWLALFASMYILIFPEMASELEGLAGIAIYRAMGIDMGSFAGFIASVVIQIMPIVLGVYVIFIATGTLAGEEENGTLELVVAMPIPRWRIVAMKAAALLIVIFLMMVILGLGSALALGYISSTTELVIDVDPSQLFVALLGAYPLMVAIFGVGLFLGAFMPSRRLALAVMFVLYLASYIANSIALMVQSMEWLRSVSLFSYVNSTSSVFTEGLNAGNMLFLLAVGLVFIGLAMWSFQGRNITVGQWPWQRQQSLA